MKLSDLFVSYTRVDPVEINIPERSGFQPIYMNFDRARSVATPQEEPVEESTEETPETVDMSSWRVQTTSQKSNTEQTPAPASDYQPSDTDTEPRSVKAWKSIYSKDRNKWITDMVAAYRRAGLNDNAIRNLIAKNAGESGWGRSAQGAYNFGNITTGKSWKGKYVKGKDHDGNGNPITNYFRAYDSLDDYVRDEIQFLTRLYDFDPNDDIVTFTHKLQGGNRGKRFYAGAKNYKEYIQSIYRNVKI